MRFPAILPEVCAFRLSVLVLWLFVVFPCAPAVAARAHADADRDGLFDDLEPELRGTERVNVVVSLRAPASAARLSRLEDAVGPLARVAPLRLVDAFAVSATPQQVRELAELPGVAHVEHDATVVPFGVTAQSSFGIARAREDVPALDGSGLVAAIIDSGIDTSMPDLPSAKVIGWADLVAGRPAPYDDLGHGSLVAGILAGTGASGPEGRGVAAAASLVGVKVIDGQARSSLSKIAEGIQWAVEHRARYGIDVINLSIGDPDGCGGGADVASQAVEAAVAAGLVVVAAAGNAGPGPCTIKSPAAAESALTVGAMADAGAGGFFQGWFSSRGPTADGRIKPDVSAPGVNVMMARPGGGHERQSGTSAAAPFVSGLALLMLQTEPGLTPAQVKRAIERTAVDWGRPGRDNDYGAGRLDAYAALREVGSPLALPPAVPDHRRWGGTLTEGAGASREIEVTDARFPLALTLHGPSAGFDLSLRDASGAEVGTRSEQYFGASRQEDLHVKAPAPGRYTAHVVARAGGGDFDVDVSGALAADTVAPALTLEAPAVVRDATLRGDAGGALGDFPGVVVHVTRDGERVRRVAATPVLGRWSVTVPLEDGTYVVQAEQGDNAGNATRTPARALTVDTVAPRVALSAARDAVIFSASEPSAFTCRVAAGDREPCASPLRLADGHHRVSVSATDAAGNVGSAEIDVTVDTTPPTVAIDGGLAVSASDGVLECRLDQGRWTTCGSYAELAAGPHVLEARATDAQGNVGFARREWTVAPAAPVPQPQLEPPRADPLPPRADPLPPRADPLPPRADPLPPRAAVPVIRLTVSRQRLTTVLKRGLRVKVSCACAPALVLEHAGKTVARGTPPKLVLTAAAGRRLAKARSVTLTLRASAPGAKTVTRKVVLRRR